MSASKDLLEKQVLIENERLNAGIEQEKVLYGELWRFYKELIDIPIKDNGSYKNDVSSKANWLITMCSTILGVSSMPNVDLYARESGSYRDVVWNKNSKKGNNAFNIAVNSADTRLFADYEPRYRPIILSDGSNAVEPTVYKSGMSGNYNCLADFLIWEDREGKLIIKETWETKQRKRLSDVTKSLADQIIVENEKVGLDAAIIILEQEKQVLSSIKSNKSAKKISNVLILFLTIAAIYLTWKTFF